MIYIASTLGQKNGGTWPLVEDTAFKGGYQVRADNAARDSIDVLCRKQGMLCYTIDSGKVWVLGSNLTSWSNLNQTIDSASTSVAGLMSASDKLALANLVTNGVTSVTANAPVNSSGGKTPIISMPACTSSVDGYLRASDWTIFNAKGSGNGTVTAVTTNAPLTSSGGTTPVIAMPAASASTAGYLTATDWNTFNNKASGSSSVSEVTGTSPVVSSGGNAPVISMPAATSAINGYLKATDWVIFNSKGSGNVVGVTGTSPVVSSGGTAPVISMAAATSSVNGYLRASDWVLFNSKGNGNVNTVSATSPVVSSGGVDPIISMPAASTSSHGYMTNADKSKLDGIQTSATNYTHPSGDGSLHVPATGTTNSGKFLMAGATAGLLTWDTPIGGVTSVNGQTGAVTLTSSNITGFATTDKVQFAALGVGTATPTVTGEIRATNNITAFYSSDRRLKENIIALPNALARVEMLTGVEFDWTDAYLDLHGGIDDYFLRKHDVGLIAQDLKAVLPEVVGVQDDGYLAVKYDRVVALLVEAIKDLSAEVRALKG